MKVKFLLLLLTVCLVSTNSLAQTSSELRQATLFSPLVNNNEGTRSLINFETGELGAVNFGSLKNYDCPRGRRPLGYESPSA